MSYRGPVYRFLRRTLDPQTAEDALQETFIRAFRSLDGLRDDDRFEPWLLSIARREAIRAGQRRSGHESLDTEIERVAQDQEAAELAAEEERLLAMIRELAPTVEPPEIREVAMRYYLHEPTTAEAIAKELGLRPGTVRKRLFTFRERLRVKMLEAGGLPS